MKNETRQKQPANAAFAKASTAAVSGGQKRMTERNMANHSDLPDDFDHYEYHRYISGGDEPDVGIRDLIDKNGLRMGSQTINPETGQARISSGWVSGIRNGPFFEDSTEEEFNRLNAERMEWVRKRKREKREADCGPNGDLSPQTEIQRDESHYIRDDNPHEPVTYRYYTLGSSHPLRVMVSPRGNPIGVEGPDRLQGRLIFKPLLLRLQDSPDAEEIDRHTFERMCRELDDLDVTGTYGTPAPPRL